MCIRDRAQDAAVSHGEKGQLPFFSKYDKGQGRRNDTPVTVSYTHLDVYKRQVHIHGTLLIAADPVITPDRLAA